jgi:hemimethylated DNA binding protein
MRTDEGDKIKMSNQVSRKLFKHLQKWARANADVPYHLKQADLAEVLTDTLLKTDPAHLSVAPLATLAFRDAAHVHGPALEAALDRGFTALRILHTSYSPTLDHMRALRREHADRDGVRFHLGTVFRHAKFGYKGVVYGWDRVCDRDDDWVAAMHTRGDQPFYHVLPDEADCHRLFGGVRLTKYVAEENVVPLEEGTRVTHRALDSYFLGYDASRQRYIPNASLQFQFPDEYAYDDGALVPASEDANLLAHPEPDEFHAVAR